MHAKPFPNRNDIWDDAVLRGRSMTASGPPLAALPSNWHAATAPDGQGYYFNDLTRETSWTEPGPHPAAEPGPDPASPHPIGPTTASPQPIGPAAALQQMERAKQNA